MKRIVLISYLSILIMFFIPSFANADEITIDSPCLNVGHYSNPMYSYTQLEGYDCDDGGNVIIPDGIDYVDGAIFDGKEINSISISGNTTLQNNVFNGAIIVGDVVFEDENNKIWNENFNGVIIGNGGSLTINSYYKTNNVIVENGGTLNVLYNTNYYYGMLNYSTIEGNVNILGNIDYFSNSFNNSLISDEGNINLNNIQTISDSFNGTTINNEIDYSNISTIGGSFKGGTINGDMDFSNVNLINNNTFQGSTISGNISFLGDELTIDDTFFNVLMTGNIIFNNNTTHFEDVFEGNAVISGNVICESQNQISFLGTDINSILGSLIFITNGNFNIQTNGLNVKNIGLDLIMSGNDLVMGSLLRAPLVIGRDLLINGKEITAQYGTFNNITVNGNFILSGDYIDINTDSLNGVTADNLIFNAKLLKASNYVLNSLNLLGDLQLPYNTIFGEGYLGGVLGDKESAVLPNIKVTIGNSIVEQQINSNLNIVTNPVGIDEVEKENNKTKIQNTEIQASSGKVIEYEGGIEVYFQDNNTQEPERIEGIAKFSAPIAIKVPVLNTNSEHVRIKVKHANDDEFGYIGLTLNPQNTCDDGNPVSDLYSGENVLVNTDENGEKFATIYTCSASTFVAYSENDFNDNVIEQNNNQSINNKESYGGSSSGAGRLIKSSISVEGNKSENHNSAEEKENNELTIENSSLITTESEMGLKSQTIEKRIKSTKERILTRGEVAVMTNILLDVYPQLAEKKTLNEVSEACENYIDGQDFTKDEKKAITRLCKLSIMGIHNDNKEPLDEFLAKQKASNGEFATVMDRVVSNYNEKDLSTIKEALNKLEGDEEGVVFGTVYNVFMSIKNIFQK